MSFQPVFERRLDGAAPSAARSLTSGSGAAVTDYAFADAEDAVRRALGRRFPDDTFRLTAFQDSHVSRVAWAFRCKKKGENSSLVCKAGAPTEAGRARLATEFRLLRGYRAALGDGHDTVPEALHFDSRNSGPFHRGCQGQDRERAFVSSDLRGRRKARAQTVRVMAAPLSWALCGFSPVRPHTGGHLAVWPYAPACCRNARHSGLFGIRDGA